MKPAAKLLVVKNGVTFDMSDLVSKVTWSGRKGSAARVLQVEFIDDDGYKHERSGLDIEQGHQCVFYWKDAELFRGMFMTQSQSNNKTMTAKAYDNGIYLANNKDTFNYSNKKASEIFADCCTRFGIPTGSIADTKHRIAELPKPKTTAWDVIADALGLTYEATGVRYYPISQNGKISLIERRNSILQWVIEAGVNLESYSMSKSIEKTKTRVKLLSNEGTVLAEASDSELEKKIGIFQDIISKNDEMNSGSLTEAAKTSLSESKPTQNLSVSAVGLPDVITGIGVFINIRPLNLSKTYYVEEDTHYFTGHYHSMSLKLCTANDIDKPK